MELPAIADSVIALAVGGCAVAVIVVVAIFTVLHAVFFTLLPLYGFLLSLGILFNFQHALHYTIPVLKSLHTLRGTEGAVILKIVSLLLLGYSASLYHVGKSKCSTTKATNALLFSLGSAGVWITMTGRETIEGFLQKCVADTEGCVLMLVVASSLMVSAGHYVGPLIEDYLSNAGCQTRPKVMTNAHGPSGR